MFTRYRVCKRERSKPSLRRNWSSPQGHRSIGLDCRNIMSSECRGQCIIAVILHVPDSWSWHANRRQRTRLCLSRRFERWRCDLFAGQPAVDRRRQSSKKRRPPERESLRQEKMRVGDGRTISFSVDFDASRKAGELNRNKIWAVRIHSCTMRWLKSHFGNRRHGVVDCCQLRLRRWD